MEALHANSDPTVQWHPAASLVEQCVKEINHAVRTCTGWAIVAGKRLLSAKSQFQHGDWMSMFQRGRLNFGLRTAEMLMRIAAHPTLSNRNLYSILPPAWSVLHELSKVPAALLEREIQSGKIHPELRLAEARQIVERVSGKGGLSQRKRPKKVFYLERQRARLTDYLRQQAERWPVDQHSALADLLEETARKLRTGGNRL